jgi:hypothetical protein
MSGAVVGVSEDALIRAEVGFTGQGFRRTPRLEEDC